MFPITLYVIGAALLLGAALAAISGLFVLLLPQLILGGLLLIVGLAIERWRYKPLSKLQPDPRWSDTGERFVDPESGVLVAVYFDPADGSRHYLEAERA